jgi:hypothetical protein
VPAFPPPLIEALQWHRLPVRDPDTPLDAGSLARALAARIAAAEEERDDGIA